MNEKFSSTWILLFCGLVVLLCGSFQLPLLDRDEPRVSRATVEMAEKGNWVIPYFNGEYRFDKPPLTYWWMGVHHWIFGVNEFSSRLHSILATLLVGLWMIYRGKIWVGDQAARMSPVCRVRSRRRCTLLLRAAIFPVFCYFSVWICKKPLSLL